MRGKAQRSAGERTSRAERAGNSARQRPTSERRTQGRQSQARQTQVRQNQGRQATKRPVSARPAPRKRTNPARSSFQRRLLTILLIVVLAIVATFVAVKYALSKIEKHTVPINPVEQFDPVACSSSMLSTTVQVASTGKSQVAVSVSITNKGDTPCSFDAADLRLQLASGDQTAYDSQVCESGPAAKILLLDTGLTTTQTLTWNGINAGANCQGQSLAGAGTYVARVFLGTDPLLESGYIFELTGSGAASGGHSVTDDGSAVAGGDGAGGADGAGSGEGGSGGSDDGETATDGADDAGTGDSGQSSDSEGATAENSEG